MTPAIEDLEEVEQDDEAYPDVDQAIEHQLSQLRQLPTIQTVEISVPGGWLGVRITEHATPQDRWIVDILEEGGQPIPGHSLICNTLEDCLSWGLGNVVRIANSNAEDDANDTD